MDEFSTQYLPSSAGLIRAMPLVRRALKLGDPTVFVVFFLVAFCAAFAYGLIDSWLPSIWPRYPRMGVIVLGIGLLLLFFATVIVPWSRTRMVKRFDRLLPPTTTRLAVDASGLTLRDEFSQGHWAWEHIRGAVAAPDGVALLMGYSAMFVPAAAFRDAAEQAEFVALVNRHSPQVGG